ncbi:SDR family oxidoreductase [Burkholderiaceae bacterium DAT-1]|nr:SDR family oxidoreductase [Burkholderiaceae bacterium DAT-1]
MFTTASPVALITGGSRGLGREAALHLARQGTGIILTWQSREDEADRVVEQIQALGGRAAALQLDVSHAAGFADFADRVQTTLRTEFDREWFDYLFNNAGIGIHVPFVDTTEAQLDQLFNIHVKGPFLLTQSLLPLMRDGGRILNVSSGLTRFALPGYAAYAAMKGAMEVLTRYQAKELGARGIRVNTLAPGAIETDFGGGAVRDNADINRYVASQTALGRVGMPDDIGGVVAALLGEGTGWINAQRIEASGGMFV